MVLFQAGEDLRLIREIVLSDDATLSFSGVAEIILPYYECGQLWFAICQDGKVIARVNANFVVSIVYK